MMEKIYIKFSIMRCFFKVKGNVSFFNRMENAENEREQRDCGLNNANGKG